MQVQIKFKTTAITAKYGTFTTGDLLRCSEAEAKHFVEDCMAAEYVNAPAVEKSVEQSEETKPARAKKGAK